jgi:hypothetical protein
VTASTLKPTKLKSVSSTRPHSSESRLIIHA